MVCICTGFALSNCALLSLFNEFLLYQKTEGWLSGDRLRGPAELAAHMMFFTLLQMIAFLFIYMCNSID